MAGEKKTYTQPKCGYHVCGNHLETDGSVKHRISGTSMAGILGISKWSSPFQAACALLGLGREDVSSKPSVIVGRILEAPIIKYADSTWTNIGQFIPADVLFDKRKGDHDSWVSDFKDEVFAGHVDGVVINSDNDDFILEVKTTSAISDWEKGVPEYYFWQIALYNHFICKKDVAYVALGMVNEFTLKDPYSFVPTENNTKLFKMPIDREMVSKKLDEVKKWYEDYICKGKTPDYDPNNPRDVELFEHLVNLTRDVEDIRGDLDRLNVVEREIAEYESAKAGVYAERDLLKSNLKSYILAHNLSRFESRDGSRMAYVSVRNSTEWDEEQMVADGIDVKKYRKTEQKTIVTFKPIGKK